MQLLLLTLLAAAQTSTRAPRQRPLRNERGDVPGWVLVTVMTAGLVMAIWGVADGQLSAMLTNALAKVR